MPPRLTPRPTAASAARAARNATNRNLLLPQTQRQSSFSTNGAGAVASNASTKGKSPIPRNPSKCDSKSDIQLNRSPEPDTVDNMSEPPKQELDTYIVENLSVVIIEETSNDKVDYEHAVIEEVDETDNTDPLPQARPHTPALGSRPQTPKSLPSSRPQTPYPPSRPSTPLHPHHGTPASRPNTPRLSTPNRPNMPQSGSMNIPTTPTRDRIPASNSLPSPPKSPINNEDDIKTVYSLKQNQFLNMKKELDLKQQAMLELFECLRALRDRMAQEGLSGSGEGQPQQELVLFNVADWAADEVAQLLRNSTASMEPSIIDTVTQLGYFLQAWQERSALLAVGESLVREVAHLRQDLEVRTAAINELQQLRNGNDKIKLLEDARRELEEERSARIAIKDKLSTTESQLRQTRMRVTKMDRQLREAEASIASLTGTVKTLEDQSRQKEVQLEARARKLKESLKTGEVASSHLAQQRDALQVEVAQLKEQIENMTNQHKSTVQDLTNQLKELKHTLEDQKIIYQQVVEQKEIAQNALKDNLPTEREMDIWAELQATKETLRMTEDEMSTYKREKVKFLETMTKIADSGNKVEMQKKLAAELLSKEEIVSKLQLQTRELTKTIKLNEQKVAQYEQYVRDLQAHNRAIANCREAPDGISYQDLQQEIMNLRMSLLETVHRNEELTELLMQKEQQLEQQDKTSRAQARVIKVREELINMLKNKETEQSRELAALQQDLEQRMNIVGEVNKQIAAKAEEIQELFATLENKQQQIHRLEKIVLALEEQQRRAQAQRTRHEEKIAALEHELAAGGNRRERQFTASVQYVNPFDFVCDKMDATDIDIDIDILIDEVQKRSDIYDTNSRYYNDRNRKKRLWEEIYLILNSKWTTYSSQEKEKYVKEVHKRWESLRGCFRRDVLYQKNFVPRNGIKKKAKYKYFNSLLFLLPFTKATSTEYTTIQDFEADNKSTEMTLGSSCPRDIEDSKSYSPSNSDDTKIEGKRFQKRKMSTNIDQETLINEENIINSCNFRTGYNKTRCDKISLSNRSTAVIDQEVSVDDENFLNSYKKIRHNRKDDDDKAFLMSLLPILRDFTLDEKILLRIELMQTIVRFKESRQVGRIFTGRNEHVENCMEFVEPPEQKYDVHQPLASTSKFNRPDTASVFLTEDSSGGYD
ncbi:unnamed protein product [Diatraea saccharalis]|uniref:MADF domain-containing protein n=1 Tax=Diatraea saccharalis TaxID=40085 RepID=A0A9N9WGH4_9NEOP|nr:unnamed protein product [Diatraea saccharalis]